VLSQRLAVELRRDPFDVYRALRTLNPSPYLFFLELDGIALVGSSPEVLVRLEEGTVTVRPIAGTRPRGRSDDEDARLAEELLADPKERAEHLMLVDLGRNDVGRVARFGSVRVTSFMSIEKYSHVLHMVSQVEGDVAQGTSAMDVFRACFPAGTVSGAPKIRAMEIIDELEPVRRGIYAGAVGYFGYGGRTMDTAIAIRTLVATRGRAYIQTGAGIVADSVPRTEYEETLAKARALLRVLAG
jgi:anthranilate synthase component I